MLAKLVSLSRPRRRSASTSTHSKTSHFSPTALDSLGDIVRQCFVKLAIPTQSLLQLLVLLDKKSGGSRTIAILHTTYRFAMLLVTAHISQWDVKFAGKWDSALKGNSALRAHVARAAGIELAHREGQHVIHFLWDKLKFYDSIKAHLLIPQLVARGYPLEILVLGSLTHIAEMSSSWQRIQRHHHWLCIQHFGRLSPELLLGQRSVVGIGPSTGVRGCWICLRRAHRHNPSRTRVACNCYTMLR